MGQDGLHRIEGKNPSMNCFELRYDPVIFFVIIWSDIKLYFDVFDPQCSEKDSSDYIDEKSDFYQRFFHFLMYKLYIFLVNYNILISTYNSQLEVYFILDDIP